MEVTQILPIFSAEPGDPTIQWWIILLIVFVVLALLIWLLTRKSAKDDQPVKMARHPDGGHAVPSNRHAVPSAPVIHDNLEIIEGIGPKIASLLRKAGITTFAQLSHTDVARLRQLMAEANLRIADPTTWPEQARLAGAGKQAELKALQQSLRSGRKV